VSTNQISFTAGAARRWPVFRRDRVGEPRAKGFSWDQIARKLTASPSVAQRAFLSEEHTLPKTTPACTAIRTGNESSSDHARPRRPFRNHLFSAGFFIAIAGRPRTRYLSAPALQRLGRDTVTWRHRDYTGSTSEAGLSTSNLEYRPGGAKFQLREITECQNRNFSATWAMRGLRAEVTLPKLALVTLPLGLLNCVWLKALKSSKRN
jgi:hypothetical protein